MTLRKMSLMDYEEVAKMYRDFYVEVYPDRVISPIYFFHKEVMRWVNENKDIIVVDNGGSITGFSMSHTSNSGGLTEPVYNGEIVYIKKEYRKGRTAYLLYNNVSNYAREYQLTLVANGLATNGTSDMIKKHFDCKEMFINFERTYNG